MNEAKWNPASEPPNTARRVIALLSDGSMETAEYYNHCGWRDVCANELPDPVVLWCELPPKPEVAK
jgi:hypothetical protein